MRYAYDQQAIAFVNRVANATSGISRDALGQFNYDAVGVSPLAAAMWFEVDKEMDWSADTDAMFDNPYADAIYELIVGLDHFDDPTTGSKKHPAWEAWDEMTDAFLALENPLYIACVVSHALSVINGDPQNIWEKMPDIDAEFKKERDEWDATFRAKMAFLDIVEINEILDRDADELKAERKMRRTKA